MKRLLQQSGALILVLVAGVYGLAALRGPNGFSALAEKRLVIDRLQEQNATMVAENQYRRKRIEQLKNDRHTQELEIREKLKLTKPGETQFILPESKSSK